MVQLHADNPEHEAVLRKTGVPRTDPTAGVLTPAEAEARNLNQAGRIEIPCNDRVRMLLQQRKIISLPAFHSPVKSAPHLGALDRRRFNPA